MLCLKGLIVVDVFQAWCGPCKTVVDLFRKIRNEVGSDLLHFAVAEADSIDALEKYRGKCEPVFLFYTGGELVAVVRGANAPLLQKTILEQLAVERKVLEHGGDRMVVNRSLNSEIPVRVCARGKVQLPTASRALRHGYFITKILSSCLDWLSNLGSAA
ncbi:thioredoxin domain-containing protein 6 isoform X3 [Cuculus canorus]|nr:thioredoxin domain-containing protein 6 isoform X3 [Cuculus canorus]XP_053930501.1 thioredoxin domain-containing protein 6 isoform X3 [Cuculus canorus]XP_053930502.1 thioredoxin domain-containing protein 6 isoform X3 [Cuculus canorus]